MSLTKFDTLRYTLWHNLVPHATHCDFWKTHATMCGFWGVSLNLSYFFSISPIFTPSLCTISLKIPKNLYFIFLFTISLFLHLNRLNKRYSPCIPLIYSRTNTCKTMFWYNTGISILGLLINDNGFKIYVIYLSI